MKKVLILLVIYIVVPLSGLVAGGRWTYNQGCAPIDGRALCFDQSQHTSNFVLADLEEQEQQSKLGVYLFNHLYKESTDFAKKEAKGRTQPERQDQFIRWYLEAMVMRLVGEVKCAGNACYLSEDALNYHITMSAERAELSAKGGYASARLILGVAFNLKEEMEAGQLF